MNVLKGFKNFLLRGDVVVISIGLIVATAFSTLIKSFTSDIISPLISRVDGRHSVGLGVNLGSGPSTFVNFGDLISNVVYFIIFMAVIYFVIVLPYKSISAKRGVVVFGPPDPVKACPACLSDDLPLAATKCKYCGTDMDAQPVS